MRVPLKPANPPDSAKRYGSTAAAHIDRVIKATQDCAQDCSQDCVAELVDPITRSWRRSASAYRVDPSSKEQPRILTSGELKERREPLAKLIAAAQGELDELYAIVKDAKYTVLLCDNRGVAVNHRGDDAEAESFKYWGTWLGGVWSEDVEGTNGIGTCIVDNHPVTIHHSQHFRARHVSLSCSGAPIFNSTGELTAVLDVSSIDPQLSQASHALTGPLTRMFARAIEERCFRESVRRDWIIAVAPAARISPGMLFAVDADHRLVGADHYARRFLAQHDMRLKDGVNVWSLFERNPDILRKRDRGDLAAAVRMSGSSHASAALITPPEATWRNLEMARLHSRPRLHGVRAFLSVPPPAPRGGGLAPVVLLRVKGFVEKNLDRSVSLQALAKTAGLSVFHFARAFKQSEGLTPHAYLLERRIQHAQKLLTTTALSLADVARQSGFADQGHLARHFRRRLGTSPSAVRKACK
jgi:AraC-like DNA-binding protein